MSTTLGRVVPKDRYSTSTPLAIGAHHGRDQLSLPYTHGVCHRPSRTSPPLSGVSSAVTVITSVKDPLNSAFLDAGACCSAPAPSAVLRITHHANRLLSWKGPSAGAGSGGEHEADGEQKAVGVAGHVAAASRGRAGARVLLRGAAMQVTRVASALCVSSLCTPIAPRCALAICAG